MKELNDLQSLVFVSIISADNDEFGLTEDQKQEIISRYRDNQDNPDWAYIFECMPNEHKQTIIDFFNDKLEERSRSDSPNREGMA